MEKPKLLFSETAAELPPGEGNPRNSEGDFAVLKDGRILFAYSRYTGASGHDDAPCSVGALVSADHGRSFQPLPFYLAAAEEHGTRNIMSVSLCRTASGVLCLFYLCKKGAQSEVYLKRCTNETALSFGEPELIVPPEKGVYYVVNNCRVCVLPDGALLLPMARHKIVRGHGVYFGACSFFKSDAAAENWRQVSGVVTMPLPGHSETGLQEPGAVPLPDGRLYAYFRTDRGFQYESFSPDGGASWTRPVPSRFTSPDSPMLIRRNPYSGVYYAFWNPVPNYNGRLDKEKRWIHAGRTPLVMAASENGLDYSRFTVLEDQPDHGYCYPAVLFLNEKELLLAYCCGGARDGTCLSKTRIRRIVLE